jgi:hypothetical protein
VITIEPMLNLGTKNVIVLADQWTVVTGAEALRERLCLQQASVTLHTHYPRAHSLTDPVPCKLSHPPHTIGLRMRLYNLTNVANLQRTTGASIYVIYTLVCGCASSCASMQGRVWLPTVHCALYTMYTIYCTLYTMHYTLYMCTVHYTLFTIHCTLYTAHCTHYILGGSALQSVRIVAFSP